MSDMQLPDRWEVWTRANDDEPWSVVESFTKYSDVLTFSKELARANDGLAVVVVERYPDNRYFECVFVWLRDKDMLGWRVLPTWDFIPELSEQLVTRESRGW